MEAEVSKKKVKMIKKRTYSKGYIDMAQTLHEQPYEL